MSRGAGPLLTYEEHRLLLAARASQTATVQCSFDLGRTQTTALAGPQSWHWQGVSYPYLSVCKDRTIYHWTCDGFEPASRFNRSLIKLVPTQWGPPTFEIDGIKMLPTAHVSPYADAQRKVALVAPRGKRLLDTCGGLGYFAACGIDAGASHILSFEKNADVIWLRGLNPWSPEGAGSSGSQSVLSLVHGDVVAAIETLPAASVDAVLHDPPRFGIAGELYSQSFYDQLARVLRLRGKLFHYTGSPNKLTSGRDVPAEVAKRLRRAGFATEPNGDGLLASRTGR